MKTKLTPYLLAALLGVAFTTILHADLVFDGGSTTINTATNVTGDFIVGKYADNTTLNILAPGTVTNDFGYIGWYAGSDGNKALVQNSGAVWKTTYGLDVGASGAANLLVVTNGGNVFSETFTLGFGDSSIGNQAIVTGTNSLLKTTSDSSGTVGVGNNAPSNSLVIANGGSVANHFGVIGATASASNNWVTVADPGSSWSNSSYLYVGSYGSGNELTVRKGALVANNISGYIGFQTNSDNNTVSVIGSGSLWTNNGDLYIGYAGNGNQLVVRNGAVVANNNGTVGGSYYSTASNNTALITGPGSLWNNKYYLFIGYAGSGNQLVVSNSAVVASQYGEIGFGNNNKASVLITGSGSSWSNSSYLYVGLGGVSNQLVVSKGAMVANTAGSLGANPGSDDNTALITDSGSFWNNSSDLKVGDYGSGNQLTVSNGGMVANASGYLGYGPGCSNNTAIITGSDSLWTNTGNVFVGYSGSNNTLLITNSATVVSPDGRLGGQSGSDDNLAVVSDGGQWIATGSFRVGNLGSGNELRLLPGGIATAADSAYIGHDGGSSNNLLYVKGGTLTVATSLDVRRGELRLDAGTVSAGILIATNATRDGGGFITFKGGTLSVSNSTVNNGVTFVVGDHSSSATYELLGNGLHIFAGGLAIVPNAELTIPVNSSGIHATIGGAVILQSGGLIDLEDGGPDILTLSNSPSLQGQLVMQIAKPAGTISDQIKVLAPLTYGGSLTVSLVFGTLAPGDTFKLFDAPSYGGHFANVVLPTLSPGLSWTNRLSEDGTIVVMPPVISSTTKAGTHLVFNVTGGLAGDPYSVLTSTNLALPLASWTTYSSGTFDGSGNATITNAVNPASPQRFFTIRSP